MALGTVLASAMTIGTSYASHSFSFSPDGNTAANEVLVADGKLTVCLMDYHHDYGENEPASGGAKTIIGTYLVKLQVLIGQNLLQSIVGYYNL